MKASAAIDHWATQKVKLPIARRVARAPFVTANVLNCVGLGGCLLAAILQLVDGDTAAAVVFAIASTVDVFDGSVARLTSGETRLGAWQDAYFGSVGELVFVASFVVNAQSESEPLAILGVVVLTLTTLTSQAKSVAGEYGLVRDWSDVRVFGRGLRIAILSIGLFTASLLSRSGFETTAIVTLILLVLLNVYTIGSRVRRVYAGA